MKKVILLCFSLFLFSACGAPVDIINPEAKFLYFYGSTCSHCQELNNYMKEKGLYDIISLEKREVYFNTENNAMFLAKAKELGLEESKIGVPFVVNLETKTYTIGVEPAINQFNADIESRANSGTGKNIPVSVGTGEILPEIPKLK